MKPLIDERRLQQVNAELDRALTAEDADVLAGRLAPRRRSPSEQVPAAPQRARAG